mmetsp:Transcript_53195/g.138623  ORF Transcript_53195/g.138623 Transcript_53195/m.138623 type:complete len:96 (-) Transcript_53195:386-673(-)
MEINAAPSGSSRRRAAYRSRVPSSPTWEAASSRHTSRGFASSTRAKATRCCSPPESTSAQFFSTPRSPSGASASRRTARSASSIASSPTVRGSRG